MTAHPATDPAMLAYIRAMVAELASMAQRDRAPMLAFLLEMAALEAEAMLTASERAATWRAPAIRTRRLR